MVGTIQSYAGTQPLKSPATEKITEGEAALCQEGLGYTTDVPRIRLLVNKPRITLNFKLPQTGQHGGKKGAREKKHG